MADKSAICGVAELSTPEQFLISALRLWNQSRRDHGVCCCRNLLRNGFQAADLQATEFEIFDRVNALIDAACLERDWIEHPHDAMLGRHELWYLRVLAQCQNGSIVSALHFLSVWLPLAEPQAALRDLTQFARACAAVGLVLPQRNDPAARPENIGAIVIPLRPPSARLH